MNNLGSIPFDENFGFNDISLLNEAGGSIICLGAFFGFGVYNTVKKWYGIFFIIQCFTSPKC